ncbi:hypothetical protein D9M68_731800 [compost metagenome]
MPRARTMSLDEVEEIEREVREAAELMPGSLVLIDLPADKILWLLEVGKATIRSEA